VRTHGREHGRSLLSPHPRCGAGWLGELAARVEGGGLTDATPRDEITEPPGGQEAAASLRRARRLGRPQFVVRTRTVRISRRLRLDITWSILVRPFLLVAMAALTGLTVAASAF
jgi:hypothetical protein